MRTELQDTDSPAINPAARSGSDEKLTAQSDSEGNEWFTDPARVLLGKHPGLALRYITGFPESSCDKYASGTRKTPGFFIVTILRSKQGGQFFDAFMHGCTAPWWLELQAQRASADKLRRITNILNE